MGGFNSSLLRRLLVPLPKDMAEQKQIADVFGALIGRSMLQEA
jgi:hypothetical protein